jgi:mono/diheme cytochrome c family protein
MSKSERQLAAGSGQLAVRRKGRLLFYCLLLTANCLLFIGCRQDMQDQPRYEAYEASNFFKDGLSSRPLPEGTVARGYLMTDKQLCTGKMDQAQGSGGAPSANANTAPAAPQSGDESTRGGGAAAGAQATDNSGAQTNSGAAQGAGAATAANAQQPAGEPDDVETFPIAVTAEVLNRGQERYEIFCAMCHGSTGYGDGMIVRRGFRKPPSYHEDRLRQARVGHIYRVITEGYGAMPPYKAQIPVQDRWAIVAYMRALQFSQQNTRQAAQPAASPAHGGAQTGGHK